MGCPLVVLQAWRMPRSTSGARRSAANVFGVSRVLPESNTQQVYPRRFANAIINGLVINL